ncbi:hypothetical protein Rin_00020580, partial [Candidatus Regiella insecticola 5.15]
EKIIMNEETKNSNLHLYSFNLRNDIVVQNGSLNLA